MVESKLNTDALERYSKSFSTIVLDQFFDKNEFISGQQIVNLTPIKQLNFFVLKVLFSQWQDETKKFRSPFFDYSNESVKHALKTLVNALSKNISIERESFEPLFEKAIKDCLALIYEPAVFFMKEIDTLPSSNFNSAFKSLSRYFKIRKDLFNKISDELNEGNIDKEDEALYSLIEDTCKDAILSDVNNEINLFNQILALDLEEPATTTATSQTAEPALMEPLDGQKTSEDSAESEHANLDGEFEPIVEGIKEEEEEIIEESIPNNVNEKFSSETPIINKKFEQTIKTETVAEKHETKKVSELHSSISVNQRYMFLNDLFENDVNEYNTAIDQIENCDSFDDSVEYLMQNYSRKYQWDMSSDEVKELLKVIFKKFR